MAQLVECRSFIDSRGRLTVAESELPFRPARLFWITEAANQHRGGHGHKRTRMVLFALAGRIRIDVRGPDGSSTYILEHPGMGLVLEPEDWHTMDFLGDAILLVAASEPFDADDYVTNPPF